MRTTHGGQSVTFVQDLCETWIDLAFVIAFVLRDRRLLDAVDGFAGDLEDRRHDVDDVDELLAQGPLER